MDNDFKLEFIRFEKCYFNCQNFDDNNFYDILNDKEVQDFLVLYFLNNPVLDENLDGKLKKDFYKLCSLIKKKKLDFKNFNYLKSEKDILNAYLGLFLLKVFSLKLRKKKNDKDSLNFSLREFFFDRNDFINAFSDLLLKFFIFNEIKHRVPYFFTKDSLRVFSLRFVELCVKKNIITVNDLKMQNRHYKILEFRLFVIPYSPHIMLYTEKFDSYVRSNTEFYSYNYHFSSLFEVTKKARYSDSRFKIPVEQLVVLYERYTYIDRTLLEKSWSLLLADESLTVDSDLEELYQECSKKIEMFVQENDLGSLKFFSAKLSKLLTLIRIKKILSLNFDNKKLYYPFMFCFRGRIYELSDLSFTFYKEFRYCLYGGVYEEGEESEKFHFLNSKITEVIDSQFVHFEKFIWFKNLTLIKKRACVWIFVSIGAIKKTTLGIEIHISVFIKKGLELWELGNAVPFDDVYDKIEFNYFLHLIKELQSSNSLKKWIFWKDAPASCFQHLLMILGPGTEDSYKICNLDSCDTYYDPYGYLIDDFFKNKKEDIKAKIFKGMDSELSDSVYNEIFNRKRLKKIFMTESYGAGYQKLTSFFLLDLNFDNYEKTEKSSIMLVWKELFGYITSENILFAKSSKQITKHFVENDLRIVVNPDGTEVDYSCFKIVMVQVEAYIEKKRHTLQKRHITLDFDDAKFRTSLRANFVHTRDALLARRYVLSTGMWSVHDCFSMDFLNITYMVAIANDLFNGDYYDIAIREGEKKTTFGIFFIL